MRRQTGPVQQWIDSIPSPIKSNFSIKNEHQEESIEGPSVSLAQTKPEDISHSMGTKQPIMTVSAPINVPNVSAINTTGLPSSLPHRLVRDPSLQSDSSHCSSVESLLELRKADPEAILLGLGFGGSSNSPQENGSFSRIPKRFLQPSKLKGIAINDFMKQQQETTESFDSVSLGYRGLTGSPHVAPSEIVQKIMQRLREHESHEHDPYVAMYNSYEQQYSPLQCNGTLSVLSPDSRQFLEQPRSKSPDMHNKRMIIGQKSFAFGHDGDLIEINPNTKRSFESISSNEYNILENSQVSNNLADNNKILEQRTIQETDKIQKHLSFDDCVEFENTNAEFKEDVQNKEDTNKNANVFSENVFDVRRASDGFYDTRNGRLSSMVYERRHSDGFVQNIGHGNENILARRRKTLRRQSRISDADATNCDNSNVCTFDLVECKEPKNSQSICTKSISNIDENTTSKNETKNYDMTKCSQTLSEESLNCIQVIDDSLSKVKQGDCCIEKTQSEGHASEDKEEKTTCCCHSGTKKYWKKMEKIIQENKNLENMVTKNRREMAEIREMLSSVLSVRLEPGF